MSSLLDLMRWDATDQIELINQPLLMMAGSQADSLYMTEEAFAKATGTKDKELFTIDGATHIETYWVREFVDAAMGKLKPFFAPDALGRLASDEQGARDDIGDGACLVFSRGRHPVPVALTQLGEQCRCRIYRHQDRFGQILDVNHRVSMIRLLDCQNWPALLLDERRELHRRKRREAT